MIETTKINTLQSIVWPSKNHRQEEGLFFREIECGYFNYKTNTLQIDKGGSVSLLTYFNALHLRRWKEINSKIKPEFHLTGQGKGQITWELHEEEKTPKILGVENITLSNDVALRVDIPGVDNETRGFLAPKFKATEASLTITSGHYSAQNHRVRDVSLGIVITHFKRIKQITNAITRIGKLLNESNLSGRATLLVIDNSNELQSTDTPNLKIIPNKNLGGSGGFARGLLELENSNKFTHCLFMDDDAACHEESIRRAMAALAYAEDEKTAIAGAMLREDNRTVLHEAGAIFDGRCRSIHHNLDVARADDLIKTEVTKKIDYGAWWFFAFPIKHIKNYPFPFFVRGDDISFGLANKFSIINLNGVCSWQDSFEDKASPLTTYLDTRNHLVLMLSGQIKSNPKLIAQTLKLFITRSIESRLYESAEAALLAVSDVMEGPNFWVKNIDMIERRETIKHITRAEILSPIENKITKKTSNIIHRRSIWDRIAFHLSMKGLLFPSMFMSSGPAVVPKSSTSNRYTIYKHKKVLYYSQEKQAGFIIELQKLRALRLTLKAQLIEYKILLKRKRLTEAYQQAYPNLTSKKFWVDALREEQSK